MTFSEKNMRQDDIGKIIFQDLFLYLMFTGMNGHCRIIGLRGPISMGQKLGILIVVILQIPQTSKWAHQFVKALEIPTTSSSF